jgi:hypothetical protein
MKKPTDKTTKLRKLVLRSQTITELTPLQLGKVAGGWTNEWDCVSQAKICVEEPI